MGEDLSGVVALVTGGSRGAGRGIALVLLAVGDLAHEYGFTDADGTQPAPFRLSRDAASRPDQ